jgi:hypothetical protein
MHVLSKYAVESELATAGPVVHVKQNAHLVLFKRDLYAHLTTDDFIFKWPKSVNRNIIRYDARIGLGVDIRK